MKIAILYSGLINDFLPYYINHQTYLYQNYDIDIYLSTYVDDENSKKKLDNFIDLIKPVSIDVEKYIDTEHLFIDIKEKYINHRYTRDCKPIRALSMFYKIQKAFKLIPNNNTYDLIIRNRLDITYNSKIFFQKNEYLNVPCGGDYRGGLLDLFGYGCYNVMGLYSDIFSHIPKYMEDNILFHPESILRYHCIKQNINIKRFNFDIFLRGKNFTQSAPCYR